MRKAWISAALSLAILVPAAAAAPDAKRTGEGFFLAVSGQPVAFRGDFDGRLVLWHFDKAFFVPALNRATALGFGLGFKRKAWLWEILYVSSRHPSAFEDRPGTAFYRSVEIDGRTFLVKDFPAKPYILVGIGVPWLRVDPGAELNGTASRASYIGLGLNLGLGMIIEITPALFVSGGGLVRAAGFYYVSGEGKGRDISDLSVGQGGNPWKSWLKTSSLSWTLGLGLVF